MVYDANGHLLSNVWHPDDFEAWIEQLRQFSMFKTHSRDKYYNQVYDALDEAAEDSNGWLMSSYIPGEDWTNTPYQPLYSCLGEAYDYEQWDCARKFFGLFLCKVLIQRGDEWDAFPKAEKEDGTLYRRRD
jgi:hypothetical protein